jgi:hypothetical protein
LGIEFALGGVEAQKDKGIVAVFHGNVEVVVLRLCLLLRDVCWRRRAVLVQDCLSLYGKYD